MVAETSVTGNQSTLRNAPKVLRPQLHETSHSVYCGHLANVGPLELLTLAFWKRLAAADHVVGCVRVPTANFVKPA
jgi:hypothetical protein